MSASLNRIRLIGYGASAHADLLSRWLKAPHVTEWWGETSLAAALDAESASTCQIIEADGAPVGFLRWHPLTRAELDAAGLNDIPNGGIDLDILIGEANCVGRGIGTEALRLAIAELERVSSATFFSMCTETRNARAQACYHKVGFAIARTFVEDDREHYFLTRPGRDPPQSDSSVVGASLATPKGAASCAPTPPQGGFRKLRPSEWL